MRRLIIGIALVFTFAALLASIAFAGGGRGKSLQTIAATCTTSGGVTVHASSRFSRTGTFTPTGGTARAVLRGGHPSSRRSAGYGCGPWSRAPGREFDE